MALSKTTPSGFGFDVKNAYHRVENLELVSKDKLFFNVRSYADIDKPSFLTAGHECSYDLDGPNPISQAYLYLKSVPEFADAVDC